MQISAKLHSGSGISDSGTVFFWPLVVSEKNSSVFYASPSSGYYWSLPFALELIVVEAIAVIITTELRTLCL